MSAVLFVIVLLFGKPMTLLFLSAKEVKAVKYAYQYMIVTTAGYSLLTLVNTVRFTIQGMGYSAIAILAGVFEGGKNLGWYACSKYGRGYGCLYGK